MVGKNIFLKNEIDQSIQQSLSHYPIGSLETDILHAKLASEQTTIELVKNNERDAFYFRKLEEIGIRLNLPQLNSVRHFQGPALVLAGAGSGKTRVLTSRVGYLLSIHRVDPRQILLVTFTKKAADEMKERLALLPGLSSSSVNFITSGTYHSIFLQILRKYGDTRKVISNEKYKHTILKMIMKELDLQDSYEPENLLALLSYYKNKMIPAEHISAKTTVELESKRIFQIYEEKKRQANFMDFDDILLDAYFILKKDEHQLKRLQSQFQYILCDEWQDTNPVQYELIKMLASSQNNLFVVGDDDQTIYEFNGADSSIILNFPKDYPESKVFYLNINYRSTSSIVGLANQVISFNKKRYKKTLEVAKKGINSPFFFSPKHSEEEAKQIVDIIISNVQSKKREYKDFAILYRNNSNGRAIFDELVLRNIPFVTYGDTSTFYENSIVKPIIDHLRVSVNPRDMESVLGMLSTLYVNREQVGEYIQQMSRFDSQTDLLILASEYPSLMSFQKKSIQERAKLLRSLKSKEPKAALQKIRILYEKYLDADFRKKLTAYKELLHEMLSELEASASKFKTIPDFLQFIDGIIEKNNKMEEIRKNKSANVVKLLTIHKSKGLEFPVVFIIGASEAILPHKSAIEGHLRDDLLYKENKGVELAIEEERRLMYVAITRAMEELYISSPREYRGEKLKISRFLLEAYPQPSRENKVTKEASFIKRVAINNQAIKKENELKREKKFIGYQLVWECVNESCKVWKKIDSYEETEQEERPCPVCKNTMKKTTRAIYK